MVKTADSKIDECVQQVVEILQEQVGAGGVEQLVMVVVVGQVVWCSAVGDGSGTGDVGQQQQWWWCGCG